MSPPIKNSASSIGALRAPTPAAGSLDSNDISLMSSDAAFTRQFSFSFARNQMRSSTRPGFAARQTIWCKASAVRQECDLSVRHQFDLANDAVATTVLAVSTRTAPVAVAFQAQGICVFQPLGRRIQRIRHVRVNTRDSVGCRTSTHSSGHSFIISKRMIVPRVDSADRQIVHRPGTGCGNAFRDCLRERSHQHIDNSLRSFHIPRSHGAGGRAFTIVPSGAISSIGRITPLVAGDCGGSKQRIT